MDSHNLNSTTPEIVRGQCSKVGLAADGRRRVRRTLVPSILAILGLTACGGVDDDTPSGSLNILPIEWELAFEDEFEGDQLDRSKWNIDRGDGCPDLCGWGNNEQQRYKPDNITVADGILTIQGRQEANGNYTSGRINTKGKFDFRYGKVEVSAKLPSGQGTWPAIWMLHSDETIYGPWPRSGEIDIMEAFNLGVDGNTAISSTAHYGMGTAPFTGTTSEYDTGIGGDMGFRTYTLEWERDKLRFYVDGVHFQTQNAQNWYVYYPADEDGLYDEFGALDDGPRDSPFDQAFHLIMNFAIGGDPVGDPDPSIFPQNFEIDYVRVYECANANPETGRGCGTADASVVPLKDNDGTSIEDRETDQPYLESMDLFTDGPETIEIKVGDQVSSNTLEVDGFTADGASVINDPAFVDPEDPENIIWHFAVSGGIANAFLKSQDLTDDELLDTGFDYSGNRLGGEGEDPVGEVAFDMLVNGISDGAKIVIKLDSGFPNLGEVEIPTSELRIGAWKTYSIKFDMFEENPGADGDGVDFTNILNPFVIEIRDGSADVFLDNIYATNACKVVGGCGVDLRTKGLPDVVVYDDAVNTDVWGRGIVASDSGSGFTDYTDPSDPNNKVNWREIDADEPERGQILEVKFNDSDAFGVWFIGSSATDLTAYGAGAVQFDIKVLDYGENTEGMTFKIDCTFPCGSGDKALGVVGDGEWETIKFPVSQLTSTGLDLELVSTGIVIFPTTQAGDITFQLDDVRWISESEQPPLQQIDLPVTFDDPAVDYSLTDFGGATSLVLADPDNEANNVAQTTKGEGSETFAGTTIGTTAGFANPIPFTADETVMSADVRVPVAGIPVRMKVETADCPPDGSDVSCFFEVDAFPTMDDAWEVLSWDFVGIDTSLTYVKATIFFDFGTAGDGSVYYWDNVRFGAPLPPEIGLINGGFETGDFTGWTVNAGDNTVGAPGVGARSGAFAGQLTTAGGSGVGEIRQTFAASPGDEINFSTWMLTEAPIPDGVSFGLAKIVFRDAAGNDLEPASVSIGQFGPPENPGVESLPFVDAATPVDTWVFSEAQGVAPDGTVEVSFLLLNVDFAGGENPIWFDDAQASLARGESELENGDFETGDFTGWVGTGDNVVGGPGVGAYAGSFAAQLTTTGGSGVAEIGQTFAASPGDEAYLGVWMLTEAAIPAGVSFGLAKVVFRDADGNDLEPASVSIGQAGPPDNPGVESLPFLDAMSPVNTWIYSEAQGVAPAGTAEVAFLLLNVDFAGGENPIWFDESLATLDSGGEVPLDQIDLPVTFDDPTVDYTVQDFGDPVSASTMLGEDPDDAGNTVAMTTKPSGAPLWAGTTIGNPDFASPIPFTDTETLMSVDVRVPAAGIPVRLKVETADCPPEGTDPTCFAETDAFPTMDDTWETLTWDFSLVGIDTSKTFVKATIFFDFGTDGNDAVYLWDNVRFGGDEPPPPEGIELVNGDFEAGDLTGWTVNAGDSTVGAPVVGAQSGEFAAQLTAPGGSGVAEILQIFAANPGDEVNFSAWLLTEAPLPAGPSFGLAKIVFKDAAGNDLEPASVSIGQFGPPENPGIESLPFLDATSAVDTWVFSEAQGVAPEGTVEVRFLLLNIDFAGGENPIWVDDAQASLVTGESGLANGDFETGDLTGWTASAGDSTVGAPGVGAQSGEFAAQLTAPGGSGVSEILQTFAASPGDEVNFSTWLLTEAALPEGPSFGLAKIVFRDADGNDLEPASVSIGQFGPPENPGIESLPFLDATTPVNTWVFSEAQGVAPAGTVEVRFLLLNVDFAGGENPIWVDTSQASIVGTQPPPELDQIDLPVTFDDPTVDYTVQDFGDPVSASTMLGEDPDDAGNTVAMTTKPSGAPLWAGTTIGNPDFASPIPFTDTETLMSVDVRVPAAGIPVRLKVETADCPPEGTDPTCFAETDAFPTMDDTWETLTWDFSLVGIDTSKTFVKATIFFDFGTDGNDAVYLWDNVRFGGDEPPPPEGIELVNGDFETGDLAGWTVNAGDNTVGAPGVGAQSGEFAAQLTAPGGSGVAELRQTFAANPGDEVNFSAWMLTEAALPAGPSFGLAKIVFRDAAGNDLEPASVSIGQFGPPENPGIESLPFLDATSAVDTWVFSEAQGVAPAGTVEVSFLLLNVDFAGGENPIWVDDAQASLVTGESGLANGDFETGDLAGWTVNAGDNTVGAPGVGAQSGEFAAQLTAPGGSGVAEIRQTFAASPGDEVNFSAWMLTEAALPEGPSFGLAKIVFRDADGNDLEPASVSIGQFGPPENPGIESLPFLDATTPVNTWVFSEAQGVAPAGTVEVSFLLLNVDFAGGENPIWVDDAQGTFVGAGP